ncbi:unnamed protein product [Choristocarpus tenellus]
MNDLMPAEPTSGGGKAGDTSSVPPRQNHAVYLGSPLNGASYHIAAAGNPGMAVMTQPTDSAVDSEVGRTTVIMVPVNIEWGRGPQPYTCPSCLFQGLTETSTDPCSAPPILTAAVCCFCGLWPCSIFPFLIPEWRDTVHRCQQCHRVVGRQRHC